jgi:hypothetical protein
VGPLCFSFFFVVVVGDVSDGTLLGLMVSSTAEEMKPHKRTVTRAAVGSSRFPPPTVALRGRLPPPPPLSRSTAAYPWSTCAGICLYQGTSSVLATRRHTSAALHTRYAAVDVPAPSTVVTSTLPSRTPSRLRSLRVCVSARCLVLSSPFPSHPASLYGVSRSLLHTRIHTHSHTHLYLFVCLFTYVCVCGPALSFPLLS